MSKADKAMSPQRPKPSVPVQTGTQPDISKLKVSRSLTHEQNPSVKPKQVVNKAPGTLPPLGFEEFKPQSKFQFAKPSLKLNQNLEPYGMQPSMQMPVQLMQMSLPKLKVTEFHGDPLEWPEWSSLFTATIHNAPIDDNARMSHLKTLVKGKAKAAIAELGYSGAMYSAAWNTLVMNFGRPQTIVNAQMKLIHTSAFIKPHDSAAIIKYAQMITTCVNVLKQFGFTGDLYSESVLNSALRKLPPELKTKWFFLARSKRYYSADLCKFSEWLNEVAYVHDEMMVQFKSPVEKKATTPGDKVKTTTFTSNSQNKK